MTGTFDEDVSTFMTVHLRVINVSNKRCRDTHNTYFIFNNYFSEEKYDGAREAADDNMEAR